MKIEVLKKDVYGKVRFYPTNEISKTICDLMERKTFSNIHLEILKKANWDVQVKVDNLC